MTETTPATLPAAKEEPLFAWFRTDPKKMADGVWIEHPDSGDRFRVRRRFADAHAAAYRQAQLEFEANHGPDSSKSREADAIIDATAMARGVIVDWKLTSDTGRAYDVNAMRDALVDPNLAELRRWIYSMAESRPLFRPDDAVTP